MITDRKLYNVKIRGVTPFIMHNSDGADPQNRWTLEMAPYKAKRKKTESDHKMIRDLSFQSSLYWSEELDGLFIPTDNLRKMILEAGRAMDQKGAKKQIVGVSFTNYKGYQFETKNRSDINLLTKDPACRYFKIVTIGKAKVPSIRAKFTLWSFEMKINIDCSIIDPNTVEQWLDYAASRIGLGARRPYAPTPGEFGKFVVEEFKEIK